MTIPMTHDYSTLSVGEVASSLGLPGSHTVRRLEARGVLPPARRSRLFNKRYWLASDWPELWRLVQAYKESR